MLMNSLAWPCRMDYIAFGRVKSSAGGIALSAHLTAHNNIVEEL